MRCVGLSAAALSFTRLPAMAGPFTREDFEKLVPADKKLSAEWIKSLFARDTPEVYRGEELKYIGMPVGGIGCGQLYLGGDGRLWLWDIFKCNYRREPDHGQRIAAYTLGGHYAHPVEQGKPYTRWNGAEVQQGFLLRTKTGGKVSTRTLDRQGFPNVTFRGEYPVGKVTYADKDFPVTVRLAASSPFIPLNARDSALPATVMSYTVTNTGQSPVEVDLGAWMQNATCPYTSDPALGQRRNRLIQADRRVSLLSTVEPSTAASLAREDILFADFERENWGDWTAEGTAFEGGPFPVKARSPEQMITGHTGERIVNSYNTRRGDDHIKADHLTGSLQSPEFTVERNFIRMSVGGGGRKDVCVAVLVAGKEVARVAGRDSSKLYPVSIDMTAHQGKKARIRIVDQATGGWAHITVDQIIFTDATVRSGIESKHGYGSTTLTLLHDAGESGLTISAATTLADPDSPTGLFDQSKPLAQQVQAVKPLNELLVGGLFAAFKLAPGESRTLDFAITWYFPDYNEIDAAPGQLSQNTQGFRSLRRHYAPWFKSAAEVAGYLAEHKERLLGGTREWNRTWYDSTLPYWLLDRSFIGLDCVASQMFHWFDSGRPYGWEGVDCCPGTCTHVWHYAQALARVFPDLERAFREMVDFKDGVGFNPSSGMINDRGDFHRYEATDGQAGTILRAYREHLTSKDDAFLRRLWPNVKKAIEFLLAKDPDANGLLEGCQINTLDAAWFGPMGWISGLYLAALQAAAAMATEMGDAAFAEKCRNLVAKGSQNMVSELFDGEYFIHKPDPKHKALQTGTGCHIDQVLGQAWMHQVGLDRVIPRKETVSALNSLWRYNFTPDAGNYAIKHVQIGQAFRWYAMPGEAGLLMTTWPKGGAKDAIPGGRLRAPKNPEVWTGAGGYFNECMNGFEYQVAAHMIYEGAPGSELVMQGLAITRAVHERYGAAKRNPYNEIECGDHYARSMASYGVFLAACGFEYNGPRGVIGFDPRLTPDNFRAPFTAAEGWGTFSQQRDATGMEAALVLKFGSLRITAVRLKLPDGIKAGKVKVGGATGATFSQEGARVLVTLEKPLVIKAGETCTINIKAHQG